ncbi:amidophosphoribosyltransferase [Pullulanibacillus camelliae]|uniref:Amidophosphoribosyltransferase n=1 Tax=Pullulanibacillus camelliae TaxID=1707096 RepID=A0A8J2VP75_9BACL|nr:ComF family protein [Pullulanibacillus camelliae]GGE36149.1 amidophosphoribosyltransferase [Pullulanibacillus camelliae]
MAQCLWCNRTYSPSLNWERLFDLEAPKNLCRRCWNKIERLEAHPPLCSLCGRALAGLEAHFIVKDYCLDCYRWEKGSFQGLLRRNYSLYHYNPFMKAYITRLKFQGDAVLVMPFKRAFRKAYQQHFNHYLPVPIPISPQRMQERAFNQAELLAQLLPKSPLELLKRVSQYRKQSQKTRRERTLFQENPFELIQPLPTALLNPSIVLIDDIYTTGATLRQAALALQPLKPANITSLTLLR